MGREAPLLNYAIIKRSLYDNSRKNKHDNRDSLPDRQPEAAQRREPAKRAPVDFFRCLATAAALDRGGRVGRCQVLDGSVRGAWLLQSANGYRHSHFDAR